MEHPQPTFWGKLNHNTRLAPKGDEGIWGRFVPKYKKCYALILKEIFGFLPKVYTRMRVYILKVWLELLNSSHYLQ